MEKLFNPYNIHPFKDEVSAIKIFDDYKLFLLYNYGIKIYNFKNRTIDLISNIKIEGYGPILILKNKNFVICSKQYLYILHKNKLNIINKLIIIDDYAFYNKDSNIIIDELFNKAIIYGTKNGLSIYEKIKNKYIISKFILLSGFCNMIKNTNDYFIIKDELNIYKCFESDYSLIKYRFDKYDYNSLHKLNNNIIILFNGKQNKCSFLDIITFKIIYTKELEGKLEELIPLTPNKYIFSINNELCLGKIVREGNKFDFIFDYKIAGSCFKNINISKNGIIFYICCSFLNILTSNIQKIDLNIPYEILPKNISDYDMAFEICLIGDSSTGKTSILNKALKNQFSEVYKTTIGFEFSLFNIKIGSKIIKLQLWDFSGANIYINLVTDSFNTAPISIIVYSINSKNSFNNVKSWIETVKKNNKNYFYFLLGNKVDLEKERQVDRNEAEKFARENKIYLFKEISAKNSNDLQSILINAAYLLAGNSLLKKTKINKRRNYY